MLGEPQDTHLQFQNIILKPKTIQHHSIMKYWKPFYVFLTVQSIKNMYNCVQKLKQNKIQTPRILLVSTNAS